ncbi:hypothetical protein MKX01_021651 [Papaver californicum]|nr:hypothetical protein MKX01_021651 [Papaver californicum]
MRGRGRGGWARRISGEDDDEEEEHHTSSIDEDSDVNESEEAAIRLEMEENEQQYEGEDYNENEEEEEEEEEIEYAEEGMENNENHTQQREQQDQELVDDDAEGQEDEEEEEEEYDDDEEQLPPKLDEGFYEIEDVRRKRVRKGQTQYLIKWRGWPETANTWEPIENLQACTDVVEAFEESFQSGSRGRKRKRRGTFSHPKKTQQRMPSSNVSGSRPGRKPRSLTSPSTDTIRPSTRPLRHRVASKSLYREGIGNETNEVEVKNVDGNNVGAVAQQTENENGSSQFYELRQRTSTDNVNSDSGKVSIHFSDMRTSDLVEGHRVELPKVDFDESIQSNRFTGARRRKSGNVRRFKKESSVSTLDNARNRDKFEVHGVEDGEGPTGDDAGDQRKAERRFNTCYITKIIKPIGYSASISNDIQDVCVTFVVLSSDGREVVVDNKQLKADNPQLLISFYEQHLRYSPPA